MNSSCELVCNLKNKEGETDLSDKNGWQLKKCWQIWGNEQFEAVLVSLLRFGLCFIKLRAGTERGLQIKAAMINLSISQNRINLLLFWFNNRSRLSNTRTCCFFLSYMIVNYFVLTFFWLNDKFMICWKHFSGCQAFPPFEHNNPAWSAQWNTQPLTADEAVTGILTQAKTLKINPQRHRTDAGKQRLGTPDICVWTVGTLLIQRAVS